MKREFMTAKTAHVSEIGGNAPKRVAADRRERKSNETASPRRSGLPQSVIARMMRKLFYHESGALYLVNPSCHDLEIAATWGTPPGEEKELAQRIGRGLLEKRIHLGDKTYIPMHPSAEIASRRRLCLCVPLVAEQGLLGLLFARLCAENPDHSTSMKERMLEQKQRFAVAAAQTLALALAGVSAMP